MAGGDESPVAPKPTLNPRNQFHCIVPHLVPSGPHNHTFTNPKKPLTPEDIIRAVASKVASLPLTYADPNVWGVLTAISANARKLYQGINMILTSDEHCIGRAVDDTHFQIISVPISGNHCKIYRKRLAVGDKEDSSNTFKSVFLKDTSTNGTYLNWEKLTRDSSEAELHHGDIISFACPPQHELSIAFVFREVLQSTLFAAGPVLKRKAGEFVSESKRVKGIGIGASEGPILLDDFPSLQRSNTELRKQLESQVFRIGSLSNEYRVAVERHEIEIKDLKELVSKSYIDQFKELHDSLEIKQKELLEINRIIAEQRHAMEGLNERLSASMESCTEANEVINSQKASISELKAQLDEEREQSREEREKAAVDLRASIQNVQAEAKEEIKELSDAVLRREREQQEVINKFQGETRQKLFIFDNEVSQLASQVREEQVTSANGRKKVEELEHEMKLMRKELECEKAAWEEAWAKVSALVRGIIAPAMRDLDTEARRLKGARERFMRRETQLKELFSTTEEISVLFAKQQEQLKALQRTLEDEENYENTLADIDLNQDFGNSNGTLAREIDVSGCRKYSEAERGSDTSTHKCGRNRAETSSNEPSVTDEHERDIRNQEGGRNSQEAEFSGVKHCFGKGGFASDTTGVGTEPVLDIDAIGTEQVLETENPGVCGDRNFDLNKCSPLAGDTMQLDDESHVQEVEERIWATLEEILHHSQTNYPLESQNTMEDTEAGGAFKTANILASEVAGSWGCSTAPSVHGETESAGIDKEKVAATVHDSNVHAAQSPGVIGDLNFDLNKCSSIAGDTMQLDDETHVQEVEERVWTTLKRDSAPFPVK